MSDMTEDAKKRVRDGICDACSAIGCNDEDICDGFQDEVKEILAELEERHIKIIMGMVYISVFGWALFDNDYSNLRRIGLDEDRRPLKKERNSHETSKMPNM